MVMLTIFTTLKEIELKESSNSKQNIHANTTINRSYSTASTPVQDGSIFIHLHLSLLTQ